VHERANRGVEARFVQRFDLGRRAAESRVREKMRRAIVVPVG